MRLRNYQEVMKRQIYGAWTSGAQNILAQLSTGSGKTILFSNILAEHPGYSIAIAHRMELVSQISLTLARYGIRHNVIAQKPTIRNIVALHIQELKHSYFHPQARCIVAGVDTLIKLDPTQNPWMARVSLVVQDEAHHVLKNNKWGKAAALFPKARGLYPSATPIRADGHGLGRHADGIIDVLIEGPSMRQLMEDGYLCDYKHEGRIHIYVPPSDLDLSQVTVSASGDYSPPKLRTAVHKSHITGDVVKHYKRIANGKLGITFAVDIESATEIAASFRSEGVPAEVISSKTPDILRARIMERFKKREVLQLVNVDLLGEGVDVPAIEVISMARPTHSYAVYAQQFGRALRPLEGKKYAIVIDHVGNVFRHGLPDAQKHWSLDSRERRTKTTDPDAIPLKTCLNELCLAVYERVLRACPHCGFYTPPATRSAPEFVDGDLLELDPEAVARLWKEIKRIDDPPRIPQHLERPAQLAIAKRHTERQQVQTALRNNIALWAGYLRSLDKSDSEIYKTFYFTFGVDVATAQTLKIKDAQDLNDRIERQLVIDRVVKID